MKKNITNVLNLFGSQWKIEGLLRGFVRFVRLRINRLVQADMIDLDFAICTQLFDIKYLIAMCYVFPNNFGF